MSEQELIEALALRLQDLVTKCGVCAEENMQHAPPQFFVVLAREAVRQMEWARHSVCDCNFADKHADGSYESVHYARVCEFCGHEWAGLHCVHDGYQNPCLRCGKRPIPVYDIADGLLTLAPDGWNP